MKPRWTAQEILFQIDDALAAYLADCTVIRSDFLQAMEHVENGDWEQAVALMNQMIQFARTHTTDF